MKSLHGFTLLEMIVATVILAVAVVGVMAGISAALRNAARLTSYDRAVQLARQRMNDLLLDDRPRCRLAASPTLAAQIRGVSLSPGRPLTGAPASISALAIAPVPGRSAGRPSRSWLNRSIMM